jgi:hypothetical protein
LLHADVLYMGYPLFGSIFLALVLCGGAAVAGAAGRGEALVGPFGAFARSRLRLGAGAWLVALAVAAGPVLHHGLVSGGKPLFP